MKRCKRVKGRPQCSANHLSHFPGEFLIGQTAQRLRPSSSTQMIASHGQEDDQAFISCRRSAPFDEPPGRPVRDIHADLILNFLGRPSRANWQSGQRYGLFDSVWLDGPNASGVQGRSLSFCSTWRALLHAVRNWRRCTSARLPSSVTS